MADGPTHEEEARGADTPEPVSEADALEQAVEITPGGEDDLPSDGAEIPEADAIEQSRVVPPDDDDHV